MRASITDTGGGTNKCWGHTATYLAGVDLLAGRVVSLQDQTQGSDNTQYLKVGYLEKAKQKNPQVFILLV